MSGEVYVCSHCGETCENDCSAEEVRAESVELWGVIPPEQLVVVCNDCFQTVVFR